MIRQKNKIGQAGFTVVELMIATSIFATVLIVAQAMFVQIGHLFYRGVSITGTQETADHIFQDINGNFQNAQTVNYSQNSPGGYDYYCIGKTRYTFELNKQIDTNAAPNYSTASTGGNFGLIKDILPSSGNSCPPPCVSSCDAPFKNPVELLGDKMRVEQLDICQSATSNLYNVGLVVAYGDDDALNFDSSLTASPAFCQPAGTNYYASVSCVSEQHNNFCAVGRVNTAIYKGFGS